MNCCVCWGSCCHTGPHSYCAAHGGYSVPVVPQVFPTTYPVQPAMLTGTPAVYHCEHCYCEEATKPNHRRCCKCANQMHKDFVPAGLPESGE